MGAIAKEVDIELEAGHSIAYQVMRSKAASLFSLTLTLSITIMRGLKPGGVLTTPPIPHSRFGRQE